MIERGLPITAVTREPSADALRLRGGIAGSKWGFFLRAETMHGLLPLPRGESALSFTGSLALVGILAAARPLRRSSPRYLID